MLWRAPLSDWNRCFIFVYEYAIKSRRYALGCLFVFLFCAFWQRRGQSPVMVAIIPSSGRDPSYTPILKMNSGADSSADVAKSGCERFAPIVLGRDRLRLLVQSDQSIRFAHRILKQSRSSARSTRENWRFRL